MKIKTINVVVDSDYDATEIHSYFIADNLPAQTINQSVSEAMEKFKWCINEYTKINDMDPLSESEMAEAMENEFWVDSRGNFSVDIIRSEI
jgi:hypothetical protein